MGLFNFNGVWGAKPRQFDYKPRYYDAEKEARQERKRQVLGKDYADKYKSAEELQADKEAYKPGVYVRNAAMARRGFVRTPGEVRRHAAQSRARRLVFIFIALVALAAWLLSTDKIDGFFSQWLAK